MFAGDGARTGFALSGAPGDDDARECRLLRRSLVWRAGGAARRSRDVLEVQRAVKAWVVLDAAARF